MRIEELTEASTGDLSDWMIIDTPTGTKKISSEHFFETLWGGDVPVEARRNIYRGKNLGSVVTQEQWDAIGDGSFKGLFLGDYWEINGNKWRIVDFDYWLKIGDVPCTTSHLVIMPDHQLYKAKFNNQNNTNGGYMNSDLYKTYLTEAKNIVNSAFGSNHILKHREYLVNAAENNVATGLIWADSTVEIPNELMIYGTFILTEEASAYSKHTSDNYQLSGMRFSPWLAYTDLDLNWLRDLARFTSTHVLVTTGLVGVVGDTSADTDRGIRPVFGICKQNTT